MVAQILIMPRQGNTVESCIITEWKVREGDTVTPETTVCEVETDKASFEISAGVAGTVLKLIYAAGDDVPVLQPIAVIGAPGEDWQTALSGEASVSPRAQNLAAKEALALDQVSGTGPGGRIIERDVAAALQKRPPFTAAAKAAVLRQMLEAGAGIGGRINMADMAAGADLVSTSPTPYSPAPGPQSLTPIKGIRKIISDRMFKSLAESAQFTLNTSASAVKLQEIHNKFKTQAFGVSNITINDLILFAVSRVLPRFPFMNAHKTGDTIVTFEQVHLAVAVDTPRGLMVPVIRNANLLSLPQISSEAKRLVAACQNGSAKQDELSGSTFTVTNLGNLGISSFTPILNTPEVAILGVCNIELKPVIQSVFEPHIRFSLTVNHQVLDGASAAKFLKGLVDAVAQIDILLVENS